MADERRIVTVLFADVAGSTALGEDLDPEEVRALLARYYAVAREVVGEHDGTLEKFIGDAVMAVFGLPQAHGDDPERAVAAALALRDRVRAEPRLGDRIAVRFGVSTGEVVASREIGGGDFLVTGDAVNVAARLQQAAEPGQVLASERTALAAASGIDFGPRLEVEARGKSQPVVAREALARRAVRQPGMARPPLIGRESDLEQLQLLARRALREKRPSLATVIAPAGTGKSRLLEEFLDRLDEVGAGAAAVAIAQCLPYGRELTYWPLRQVLLKLAAIPEDADRERFATGVREWIGGLALDDAESVSAQVLATLGAADRDLPGERARLLMAWRELFEAAARIRPLVLVFEDLHWSSDSLLELVEYVMQPRGEAAVMMVALSRPELLDRRPSWGGGRRNHVSLALEPLAADDIEGLVRHLVPDASPELVAAIVERSEGNPFFAGELVRSAAAHGDPDRLPDTVQASLLARLDLLPPVERRVLQLGAVFGRQFQPAGVAALEPELAGGEAACESLADRDLLRPAEDDRYVFRHILIREVAYSTLPRAERMRLHARAGEWLEARAAGREDAVAELVAIHFREAAAAASTLEPDAPDTLRLRAAAARWLTRAAVSAYASAAPLEATAHCRAALEFAGERERYDLLHKLAAWNMGPMAVSAYQESIELARRLQMGPRYELLALGRLLMAHTRMQGSLPERLSRREMDELRRQAAELLDQVDDPEARANYLVAEGFYAFWLGPERTQADLEYSRRQAEAGLEAARAVGSPNLLSAALDGVSSVAQESGDWLASRAAAMERLAFEDQLGVAERGDAYSMVIWPSVIAGDLKTADEYGARVLQAVHPAAAPSQLLHSTSWRGLAQTYLGRWDEALQTGMLLVQMWEEGGRLPAGFAFRGLIGCLDVARARRDGAKEGRILEMGTAIVHAYQRRSDRMSYGKLGGYVERDPDRLYREMLASHRTLHNGTEQVERVLNLGNDLGRPAPLELVRPHLEFAASGRYPLLEAQARRTLGLIEQEAEQLGRAATIWEALGAVPYAARARFEEARLTGDRASGHAAARVLRELGDIDYLERFVTEPA